MSGHRRAALALHGLKVQDKDWLLAQLPDQDRAILRDHLQELDSLGFRFEPGMIDQLPKPVDVPDGVDGFDGFAGPVSSSVKATLPGGSADLLNSADAADALDPVGAAVSVIAAASAEQILLLVQEEPPAWLARLLACHDWPWQANLLAQLPAPTRQRLRSLTLPAAPKLDQSLLLTLQRAMLDAPTPVPLLPSRQKPRGRFWNKWWSR